MMKIKLTTYQILRSFAEELTKLNLYDHVKDKTSMFLKINLYVDGFKDKILRIHSEYVVISTILWEHFIIFDV